MFLRREEDCARSYAFFDGGLGKTKKGRTMTEKIGRAPAETTAEDDLVTAVHRILQASPQPLTLIKIHRLLPAAFRSVSPTELSEILDRQVAAHVLCQYPKYRSAHERYWDREMAVHVGELLRGVLQQGPLPWSALRRRLPIYAQAHAEAVLKTLVVQGRLFRHPRLGRAAERYGLEPCDAKEYLRLELEDVFRRLGGLGFSQGQLKAGALELLHEEEWGLSSETPASSQPLETLTLPIDQPTIGYE
jgi:hypothetical protein